MLRIGKVLRHRTGDAVQAVRAITEELARIGESQSRAAARLVAQARRAIAAGAIGHAEHLVAQVEQALAELQTVIHQSRAATAGDRIPDRVFSLADPNARPIKTRSRKESWDARSNLAIRSKSWRRNTAL